MKPVIIITGPTAVGKSALSISVAKALDGEIISADSMQVYKGMDIGTDKITPEKKAGIRHYMIDVLEPTEEFDVYRFKNMAKDAIEEIHNKGKLPIIVGGTGFYIQALLYDIAFTSEKDKGAIKNELEKKSKTNDGAKELYDRLIKVDPVSAESIHPNNIKRVIRALEYYELTGEKISEHNAAERKKSSPYAFLYFVLNDKRSLLYSRIEKRIDKMLEEGLVDEVKELISHGVKADMTSMQAIGYKQVYKYLEGEYDYERMVEILKRDTRHFAKRQLTWFRRERDVIWLSREEKSPEEIYDEIIEKSSLLIKENPI